MPNLRIGIRDTAEHALAYYRLPDASWHCACRCGAIWTVRKEATIIEVRSLYDSHLDYFKRPKMETL